MIEIKNVSISYKNKSVLENVSMSIAPQSLTSLVGPSGCGKSTLLFSLNRLHDFDPSVRVSGVISIDGQNILDPKVSIIELRKKVGLVMQRPSPFPLSIFENVALPLREHYGLKKWELKEKVIDLLDEVGLYKEVADRLNQSALELSGGQQQRLCLARTLSLNPKVILLDEPCSSLDRKSTEKIEELLLKLKSHKTLVLVSHNMNQAYKLSDKIYSLESGVPVSLSKDFISSKESGASLMSSW